MEHKYTLKDILLEAGVREYRATEPDNGWKASEKHADAMDKLFAKHGPSSRPALLKWLAAAAASVLIIGILVFIKPVREAVSSLFTGSETDRITDTEPETEPGTDTAVPPDTEPDESTAPATDTETDEETTEVHTETDRIEDALRTAVNSGVTPQVWAKLWDLDDAGAGYHLPDVTADDPTYDYLLKKYFAAGTTDGEKAFISASLSVLLGERWEEKYGEYADQPRIPYPTKYISVEAYREGYYEGLSDHVIWLTNYRDGLISYAKYETESGCREKYPYSVKVLDAAGFHGYADQAKTDREKIVRSLSELFDLSLSVKYGAAVYDASSRTYYRRSETGAQPEYGPGDAIYKALLGYYPKSALEDAEHAPICREQALNIKYADGWLAYFSSMSSDAIANNTAKQSEYFVITEDGLVLTVAKYGAADPETVLPAADTAGATVTGTDKTGVYSVVFRITAPDGQAKECNAVFDCTDGPARLVSGTFVTDWLYSVPGASAPETTEPETTAPETTVPETTKPETTVPETTAPEPVKGKEFKSVQSSHETPRDLENATNMASYNPYEMRPGGGKYGFKVATVDFKVFDCGYAQFESYVSFTGGKLPDDTRAMLEKTAAGKLKLWLCDLDGNRIDYVYANRNGIVRFEMYPGEYRIAYEDDGTYRTCYSSVIKVYHDDESTNPNSVYYIIYDDVETRGYAAYVCIYNYKRYKPVTLTITDAKTGEPVKDVKIAYARTYLDEDTRYMTTDKNGKLKLDCIFELIAYQDPGLMNSWRDEIGLYAGKDGYEPAVIRHAAPTDTAFDIRLQKQ